MTSKIIGGLASALMSGSAWHDDNKRMKVMLGVFTFCALLWGWFWVGLLARWLGCEGGGSLTWAAFDWFLSVMAEVDGSAAAFGAKEKVAVAAVIAILAGVAYFVVYVIRLHHVIDQWTVRYGDAVFYEVRSCFSERLGCEDVRECAIASVGATAEQRRQFMRNCFYFFANKDDVGPHRQQDDRRTAFQEWLSYYATNLCFSVHCLWLLLAGAVFLFKEQPAGACAAIVLLVATVWCWWMVVAGKFPSLRAIACDQVVSFCSHAGDEVKKQVRSLGIRCANGSCPVMQSNLWRPS